LDAAAVQVIPVHERPVEVAQLPQAADRVIQPHCARPEARRADGFIGVRSTRVLERVLVLNAPGLPGLLQD
jgi:hypothetical protein